MSELSLDFNSIFVYRLEFELKAAGWVHERGVETGTPVKIFHVTCYKIGEIPSKARALARNTRRVH